MSEASSGDKFIDVEVRAFQNVTNEPRLLQALSPHEVHHTQAGVELVWRHREKITEPRMGKLHEAALRIKAKKAELEAEADKILKRLDGLDAKSPDVFDKAGRAISAQNADLDAMDTELRQLSNLEST